MGIQEVIAKFQRVLPSVEQVIPPGFNQRKGNIHKDISTIRRLCLSEGNTQDLVDWVEVDMVTPEENATHTAYFDDQILQLEDATTDTPNFMTDAQDALEWFYDTLCTYWPPACKNPHRAMLRLVTDRHDMTITGDASDFRDKPRGDKGVKNSKALIRLEDLLRSTASGTSTAERLYRNPLTILQRANLAVVFASSLLQLSKGSWGQTSLPKGRWLHRNWEDSGICFLQNHRGEPILNEPYLPILINQLPLESALPYTPPSFVALALTLLLLQNDNDEVMAEFDLIRNDIVAEEEGLVKNTTDFFALLSLIETDVFQTRVDDHYKRAIGACLTGRLVDAVKEDEGEAQNYFSRDIINPLKQYLSTVTDPVPRIQFQLPLKEWSLLADADGEKHEVHTSQARYAEEWFSKFEHKVHELVKIRCGDEQKAAIKVAIVDTGLDFPPEAEELYEDQIISRRSWALTCAIDEWQVDIITMSFGCPDRVNEIDKVMKRAQDNGIIMIAAASNSGALESMSWPARSERVIGVHALDGYGNCSDFTPNPQTHEHNFAAPGIAISGYWPKRLGMTEQRMTGTSCAAPVVAGIVAVLLEFARKYESECSEDDFEILGQLKERQGIVKVLDRMYHRRPEDWPEVSSKEHLRFINVACRFESYVQAFFHAGQPLFPRNLNIRCLLFSPSICSAESEYNATRTFYSKLRLQNCKQIEVNKYVHYLTTQGLGMLLQLQSMTLQDQLHFVLWTFESILDSSSPNVLMVEGIELYTIGTIEKHSWNPWVHCEDVFEMDSEEWKTADAFWDSGWRSRWGIR
ncbi:hypothetical protein FPRO05_10812 [Fusarium proliferatum]|uniref:Uncharacterized protein n=1 Tax=Gibberella intermedia TaxID=948311 RepID=A0A365NCK5_GIBIN|nr:hypothetical protein FPRO05_10812 [Fusarium proliferatum]